MVSSGKRNSSKWMFWPELNAIQERSVWQILIWADMLFLSDFLTFLLKRYKFNWIKNLLFKEVKHQKKQLTTLSTTKYLNWLSLLRKKCSTSTTSTCSVKRVCSTSNKQNSSLKKPIRSTSLILTFIVTNFSHLILLRLVTFLRKILTKLYYRNTLQKNARSQT